MTWRLLLVNLVIALALAAGIWWLSGVLHTGRGFRIIITSYVWAMSMDVIFHGPADRVFRHGWKEWK